MHDLLFGFAILILVSIAASLARVFRGPTRSDRVMGAQLLGTGGVAVLLLIAAAGGNWAILDVALVLALLAAFASVASFVSLALVINTTEDQLGDPEGTEGT